MHAKSLQLCPTLCDFMGCNLSGFSVHAILQAGILESVAFLLLQGIFLTQGLNSCLLCLLCWQASSFTANTTWEAL